jgi:hypothetical protein
MDAVVADEHCEAVEAQRVRLDRGVGGERRLLGNSTAEREPVGASFARPPSPNVGTLSRSR